uniref:NADH-ubiquinone oxidoreductase chain 6 n=1 Tax=Pleophylla sp. PLE01 TaxID=1205642 RepID=A0A0S2MNC6_9SCAR|nr:NADH deshydrogenase subunit 6 [Pleophylla sp. PLE01]
MIKILMTISLMMSLLFSMLTHPLSMGAILLTQTVTVAMTMGYFNYNYWFSYLLFLIMIGGMLVLFAYMTSVASNEKFKFSIKITVIIMMMTSMIILTLMLTDQYFTNLNNINPESISMMMKFKLSLNKFISYPSNIIMFMMIIYLLITLIAVVKITDIKKGPLRQFY